MNARAPLSRVSVAVTNDEELNGPFLLVRSIFSAPGLIDAAEGTAAAATIHRAYEVLSSGSEEGMESHHVDLRALPLAMALTLAGGGMHDLIGHAGEHVESTVLLIPAAAVALSLLTMAMILISTTGAAGGEARRRRALFRLGGVAALVVLMLVGGGLRPEWYLGALAAAVAAQVVLDIGDDLWQRRAGGIEVGADAPSAG